MSRLTPARAAALATIRRTFDEGAYADRAFRAEAERAGLDTRDRAFAQRLAYGTIQRRRTLDEVLAGVSDLPLAEMDAPVRHALEAGVFQLVFMDGVPDRAAVDQTVEAAKPAGGGAARFANAVMRRAARDAPGLLARLSDETPAAAAVLHSVPDWLAELWFEALGPGEARALLARCNEPAENAIRANALVTTPSQLAQALERDGVPTRPAAGVENDGLVIEAAWDAHGSKLFEEGALIPQSRASMMAARLLDPPAGGRTLDLCAAPGAKTTHLAALMGRGELVAVERDEARAEELERNCERMHCPWVEVVRADARGFSADRPFDRVLVDAPCSSLGTLQAHPDARWRRDAAAIEELTSLQAELLDSAAGTLAPGGVLLYSTCTVSPRENEDAVAALRGRRPDLELEGTQRTLPHRDRTDGFFFARLRRR